MYESSILRISTALIFVTASCGSYLNAQEEVIQLSNEEALSVTLPQVRQVLESLSTNTGKNEQIWIKEIGRNHESAPSNVYLRLVKAIGGDDSSYSETDLGYITVRFDLDETGDFIPVNTYWTNSANTKGVEFRKLNYRFYSLLASTDLDMVLDDIRKTNSQFPQLVVRRLSFGTDEKISLSVLGLTSGKHIPSSGKVLGFVDASADLDTNGLILVDGITFRPKGK